MQAEPAVALTRCRALYDYSAGEDNELTFVAGDIISNVDKISADWWRYTILAIDAY
jgi:hypothetical protein